MRRKFQFIVSETRVARACDLATRIMREDPDRGRHLGAVAERAEALSVTVPATMVDTLVASGWLHDIGYAPALRQTGFHPLDGATYLRGEGWPDPVRTGCPSRRGCLKTVRFGRVAWSWS